MKFRVRSQREFTAGLIFFSIGAIWLASSLSYRIGTATAMGAGLFPALSSRSSLPDWASARLSAR